MKKFIIYLQRRFRFDLLTFLLSAFVGCAVWYYVETSRIEERELRAELSVRIPRGWEAQGMLPRTRSVVLRGPRNVIASLRPGDISFRVHVDLESNAAYRQEVHIQLKSEDLKGIPEDVFVDKIVDPEVVVGLVRPVRKYIPVKVEFEGELPEGYELAEYSFSPRFVAVFAPREQFKQENFVLTRPVDLSDRRSSFTSYVDLQNLKLKDIVKYMSESVSVHVKIRPAPAEKVFKNVPVSLLLSTRLDNFVGGKLIPPQVSIKVEGDKGNLDNMEAKSFTAYIDTRDMGSSIQGEYVLKCHALAPVGVEITKIIPEKIRWLIQDKQKKIKTKAAAEGEKVSSADSQ